MGRKPKPAAYVGLSARDIPPEAAQLDWDAWKIAATCIQNDNRAERRNPLLDIQTNRSHDPQALPVSTRSLKRSSSFIDLTGDDDEPATKRPHHIVELTSSSDGIKQWHTREAIPRREHLQSSRDLIKVELEDELELQEQPIQLTPAQLVVVNLAWNGHNIFLTGAAGSGKTATLKEILRLLEARYRRPGEGPNNDSSSGSVEVISPTGIAALPLNGKTTYSFAGWQISSAKPSPCFPRAAHVSTADNCFTGTQIRSRNQSISFSRECPRGSEKSMQKLRVLIIEEVSMIENQFLERLNILMQYILGSDKPFGGKQIIVVGDFHQLPPVKPFEFCLHCEEPMINQNIRPVCNNSTCFRRGAPFELGEKWAFHAPAWKLSCLKHVKLEQIHRQKDTRFQDVLNKIRHGIHLTDAEWAELTAKKDGPFAVKLMSRRNDVISCNNKHLHSIPEKAESWVSLDSCEKLHRAEDDVCRGVGIAQKKAEHMETLKEHRLPSTLTLKVGAKVVLLSNINPACGLVNGSQGEVVKLVDTKSWTAKAPGDLNQGRLAEQAKIKEFQDKGGYFVQSSDFRTEELR